VIFPHFETAAQTGLALLDIRSEHVDEAGDLPRGTCRLPDSRHVA